MVAAGIAGVALAGWLTDSPSLIRGGGVHLNGMAPNTAVCLLFIAAGMCLSFGEDAFHRGLSSACAAVAFVIGALTLAEYALHADFGIDEVLFVDRYGVLTATVPGRMAMMTAALIALLGAALALRVAARVVMAQVLAIATLSMSIGRFIAYLYESGGANAQIFSRGMAMLTTIAIVALSVSSLCAAPTLGVMSSIASRGPGGALARRSLLAIATLPFCVGLLRIAAERAGFFSPASSIAFMVVTWILSGAALKVWNARHLDRVELERRQEREQSDRLFSLSADMLCIAHADGYFRRVSPSVQRTLGWTPEEFTSRPFREFVHPDDLGATLAEVERQIGTGNGVLQFQNRYRHKDGGWRALSWQSVPTPDGYMYGTARDVTEGQRREEAMRAIAKRLSLATEAAGIGIWEWNVRTGEISWDERMFAIYHVPFGVPVNYDLWKSRVHPDDFPDNDAKLQRVVADKGRGTRDFRIVLPSGEIRYLHADECVMLDASREVVSVVGVNLDMTERVRGELALEEARDQALAAARAKSDFLANMSHELRTPLNAIIGFTEMIQDGMVAPQDPEFREFLGDISKSSHHLLNLINDILDLAKVESGKMLFRPEAADLAALAGEVQSVLRPVAAARGVTVAARIAPGIGEVMVDANRLKQVLYNYVSNAIKFTPAGGRVELRVGRDQAGNLRVEVEDTGIGIAPEHLGRLFHEFEQVDSSSTKEQGGTGLGLAVTRKIVEAQGGSVGVRSTPGKGSVFSAVLPLRPRDGGGIASEIEAEAIQEF